MHAAVFVMLTLVAVKAQAESTCFGIKPKYDSQCATFKSEASCEAQLACVWGDKSKDHCFAKDATDPVMKAGCAKETSEATCDAQVACEWRSASDLAHWIKNVGSSVQGLNASQPSIPSTIRVRITSKSATHDHQTTTVAGLSATLSAWKTKYGLPDQVVSAMQALVDVESADYKYTSKVFSSGEASISEVAAAGKNYNGRVQLAFVYGAANVSLQKIPLDISCERKGTSGCSIRHSRCICKVDGETVTGACDSDVGQQPCPLDWWILLSHRALSSAEASAVLRDMQSALFSGVQAEATLLENELLAGNSATIV